jgi:hypothetical protein
MYLEIADWDTSSGSRSRRGFRATASLWKVASCEERHWVCCAACGHLDRRPAGVSACSKCAAESGPAVASSSVINLPLTFNVFACPGCGIPTLAGTCGSCGTYIDPAEDRLARSRSRALGALRERADLLVASFDSLPAAHIPVTAMQLMAVIVESDLFGRVQDLLHAAQLIGRLDLETPRIIGTATRHGIIEILDAVERVRDETRLAATFDPPKELAEVPWVLSRVAARGAAVVAACVRGISAESWREAQKVSEQLRNLLEEPPPELARLRDLSAQAQGLVGLDDLDVDARVSLALGIPGEYTDQFGFIDPIRIFSVAASEATRSRALALGAGRYFSHLLDTPVEELPPEAWRLALCAVPLAAPRYPYAHHHVAELVRTLLRQVARHAPNELAVALSLYDERDAGRAFAASTRARRTLRMLNVESLTAPAAMIESLVDTYKRFAEGPYRASMQLILAVRAADDGQPPATQPLLLGEIDARIDSWKSELGDSLRRTANRRLRNAAAHEDYHVDPTSLEVIIDGDRLSTNDLADALDRLTGTIAGIEAAVLCHRIDKKRGLGIQPLVADSDWPSAELAIRSIAGAYGAELSRIEHTDTEARLLITDPPPCDPGMAKTLLVGIQPLLPNAKILVAETGNHPLVAIGADAIRAWREAPSDESDLAIMELDFDSLLRSGVNSPEALADAITAEVRIILEREAALETTATQENLRLLERRLTRIARFAYRHQADTDPVLRTVVADVRTAINATQDAASDPSAAMGVTAALERLAEWADSRDPPRGRWRGIAINSQTSDYLFVGAHIIEPGTDLRGQVEQVLPDGSAVVRLQDGRLAKTAPLSPLAASR